VDLTTIGVYHLFINIFIEKQLEDDEALEKNLNQDKKKTFKDEDAYDSEEEKKKQKEEQKA
jgi:hypothetical protein